MKYRVLRAIAKSKIAIAKFSTLFKDKKNPIKESREKQSNIMTLLTDGLTTEESINLYKIIDKRFKNELEKREKRAISEISAINIFSSEDDSFENSKVASIIFERADVQQSL